jgi:hypothetical protein
VPAGAAEAAPPNSIVQGGEGAEWELVTTLFTGNPHTDLDFFTQADGAGPEEIFASVGTLATGGNGGGQTLVQLTEDGEVVDERGNAGDDRLRGGRDSDGCRGGRGRDSLRSCER